jgi:hypothetical protein
MKITTSILTAIALTAGLTVNISAEPDKENVTKFEVILHKITVVKLEVEIQNTPRFSFNGPRLAKQPENKEWLEIEAKLNIETKSKLDFLPSLDATFYVVTKGEKGFVRSEKTITFKNVNIEHGEAWVCAYVDPDTLRVITLKKQPKVTDITGVAVTINSANIYKGKDRQFLPYAEEIFDRSIVAKRKDATNKNARWWTNIDKSDQKILALAETPFSSILSDRYPRVEWKTECAMK